MTSPAGEEPAAAGRADRRPLLAGAAIGAAILLVVVAIAVSGHGCGDDRAAVTVTGGGVHTVPVRLVDLDIVPGRITVAPGTRLVLAVANDGAMRHDPAFPDSTAARMLAPGAGQRMWTFGGTVPGPTPDAVVFNGYYDQYEDSPLRARAGGRVRIWVVDAGLTRPGDFHLVGAQFDTVFSDGAHLVRPGDPARASSLRLQAISRM